MIQVRLNATVRNISTDNGTEFVNQTLKAYHEDVRILHQTSVAHTPQQNGVDRKPDLTNFYVFGALCYPTNDAEDLGKLKPKADIRIFSTMSNRHKDWLVQEQTALGKDFSNPFMADNLPKIVWLSTHHIYVCKELASPQGYGLSKTLDQQRRSEQKNWIAERYLEEAKAATKEEAKPAKEETKPAAKEEGKDDK
ncbi:retrovirus-related pol polyprotein from transposon TNT 1-94, partial [Tanacetum coccineum]